MSPHAIDTIDLDSPQNSSWWEEFGISCNAFLPTEAPLDLLPDDYYASWELLVHNLPLLLRNGRLRSEVDSLEVLQTHNLQSDPEWRRAYVILGFLAQGFIWAGERPAEVLPPCISVPLLEVSRRLELPPVLTYAASNLWNFTRSGKDFSDLDNIHTIHTFTGTEDESWFFMVSVAMEAKAGYAIPTMVRAVEAAKTGDYGTVIDALKKLKGCIEQVGELLERMYERSDPSVFFNQIRPYLAGSKNMADAGLPRGVFYDEGDGKGKWMQLRGGSNGQSSLIQFFDIVLGVEHASQGNSTPHTRSLSSKTLPQPSFHDEVRDYMPGPHRRFLEYIKHTGSIRDFAMQPLDTPEHIKLRNAYTNAVDTLSEFRTKHIRLVTRYIVLPSQQEVSTQRQNLATASAQGHRDDQGLTGTGGTLLLPFLKQSRDETSDAANLHAG